MLDAKSFVTVAPTTAVDDREQRNDDDKLAAAYDDDYVIMSLLPGWRANGREQQLTDPHLVQP